MWINVPGVNREVDAVPSAEEAMCGLKLLVGTVIMLCWYRGTTMAIYKTVVSIAGIIMYDNNCVTVQQKGS